MAKRKAARTAAAGARRSTGRARAGAKKKAGRTRKSTRKAPVRASARTTARKKKKAPARTRPAAKRTASKKTARKTVRKPARKTAARKTGARKSAARMPATRKTSARTATAARRAKTATGSRKAPDLDRQRRVVADEDDEGSTTPPSSLDLDRTASMARTGRRELRERYREHTETSPAMTGGDVDADWESAYSVGDEAPGGDNPTPDQDIVDDIGRAVGVQYQDSEELKGADKVSQRDKKRWELDPASSEDWDER